MKKKPFLSNVEGIFDLKILVYRHNFMFLKIINFKFKKKYIKNLYWYNKTLKIYLIIKLKKNLSTFFSKKKKKSLMRAGKFQHPEG